MLRSGLLRPAQRTLASRSLSLQPRLNPPLQVPHARYIARTTPSCNLCAGGLSKPPFFRSAESPRPRILVAAAFVTGARAFHTSRPNQGLPILPLLAGLLKTSTALEIARTTVRVALTVVPLIWLKNLKARKKLKIAEATGQEEIIAKKAAMVQKIRNRTVLFHALMFIPIIIFWATIIASLEQTPLTGRWRLILLSPEEEDAISAQLVGPGWYQAVGEILSQDGSTPKLLSPNDWRLHWVRDTLRNLEKVIPLLQHEKDLEKRWLECGPNDLPLPPPAEYPLNPRPRATEYVRKFADLSCGKAPPPVPHAIQGPPYSLIVVDKPDSSNAFSYGFGPDGGGGIVVFSGFLDDVLAKGLPPTEQPQQSSSWWSALFGGLSSSTPANTHPVPTQEQTSKLAILLAHELSHLILSHHLETLSSGSIIWPGIISIATDVIRAALFPVTMLFGPFVNDALAGMGKIGSGEITKLTEYCVSQKQEIEADVVSARLLAHAGFDPRHAIHFWEDRSDENPHTAECSPAKAAQAAAEKTEPSLVMRWSGQTHPINVVRVQKLKEELQGWEEKRELARQQRDAQRTNTP